MTDNLLIINGVLVTWRPDSGLIENSAVYIQNGVITDIGASSEMAKRYADAPCLDANHQLMMPGNICAHTHFYGAFARGMAIPGPAPEDFPAILRRLWWPLDQALDEESVRYSALVCLIDAVRHGTTTLIDHHASPNALENSLDVIAQVVEQAGLRAVLCYEVTDRYGEKKAQAAIEENVRFARSHESHPMLRGTLGLHASMTLSEQTLADSVAAARDANLGFHIHVAEHEADEYDSLTRHNKRVVDRLEQAGMLGDHTIVAHAIHVDVREIDLLRESGTWVTHQPRSNMNNAVGAADIDGMLRAGVRVCLGNDGFSNAMWAEWKAAYLLHKVWHRDPRRANGMNIIEMAIKNNAALAKTFFTQAPPGYLEIGAAGDIILVDYHPTTPMTGNNLPWHILFGFEPSLVTATICAGKILMQDRKLLFLDEEQITAHSRDLASKVWDRYQKFIAA